MTALLFLHLRQDGGNSVQNSLDVDVNLPIPFLHLEKMDWRDGHNAGVIHQDDNAAEALDGSFDERLHFDAVRDVDGDPDSLTAGGRNLVYDRVYRVRTPRSVDDAPSRDSDTGGRLGNIVLQDAGRLAQEAQQFGVYFFRVSPQDAMRTVLHHHVACSFDELRGAQSRSRDR